MVNAQAQQQLYTHAAEPKAVQQRRPKVSSAAGLSAEDACVVASMS